MKVIVSVQSIVTIFGWMGPIPLPIISMNTNMKCPTPQWILQKLQNMVASNRTSTLGTLLEMVMDPNSENQDPVNSAISKFKGILKKPNN